MLNRKLKPIAAAVGTAFIASMASVNIANADESLFVAQDLDAGYELLARGETEGKCGEGKCGEDKDKDGEDKDGEGKCGEDKDKDGEDKDGEGKCGEDKDKDGEGKCGEDK